MSATLPPEEFTRLVSKLFDAGLDESEFAELEDRLDRDSAALRTYLEMVDQQVKFESLVIVDPAVVAPDPNITPFPSRRRMPWPALAAGLTIAFALFALWRPGPAPVPVDRTEVVAAGYAPSEWREDFESGPVAGWIGRWTDRDLPAGSRGAVRSIAITNGQQVVHRISPPKWSEAGLFTVHSNSHLRLVYRVESSDWFNIFLGTRPDDPLEPPYVMHQLSHVRLWGTPGEWRRAVIPLSAFQRKVNNEFTDAPPVPGETAIDLFFSAVNNDLQLTIDRIEITADGPGTLEVRSID